MLTAIPALKNFIILILLIFFSLFIINPTYAQTPPTPQESFAPLPNYLSPQSPTYANKMVYNTLHAFSCIASGFSLIGPCIEYQLSKDLQGNIQSVPGLASADTSGGLIGLGGSLLTGIYTTPPLDARDYIADLGRQVGLVKEANAQVSGSGGTVLSPVFALWQVSRNIAYLAMILVFITVGLMVMFRQRLNPQTVVSIQMALPGLVIGLVMITFSYFIASTITDVAYLGTDLVGYYFQLAGVRDPSSGGLSQGSAGENVLTILAPNVNAIGWLDIELALNQVWNQITTSPSKAAEYTIRMFTGAASYQFGAAIGPTAGFVLAGAPCLGIAAVSAAVTLGAGSIAAPACMGPALIGRAIGTFIAPGVFGAIGFFKPPLVLAIALYFIAIFIILYTMFKLLLRLINCYLSIIFYTITGPFSLLVSSLPGRQDAAFTWMRNILCNALAFPAVMAVIYFALYFLGSSPVAALPVSATGAVAGGNTLPLFGGMDISFLRVLVAFGAILATPSIPDMICKAIGKPSQAGDLLDRGIQGNIGSGRRYSDEYSGRLGKVTGDMSSYKEKWYHNPYEPKGFKERLNKYYPGSTGDPDAISGKEIHPTPALGDRIEHWPVVGDLFGNKPAPSQTGIAAAIEEGKEDLAHERAAKDTSARARVTALRGGPRTPRPPRPIVTRPPAPGRTPPPPATRAEAPAGEEDIELID